MSKNIETKKQEVRFVTSDPDRIQGYYIARRILKTWTESHVDESGEVVAIERNEILFDKGTYISPEVQASVRFLMMSGDVKEIEVSNQKRLAMEWKNESLYPFKAAVSIKGKKKTFLLYATSVRNALTILTDYVELNFEGGFGVCDIKIMDYCTVIIDDLRNAKPGYTLDAAYLSGEITKEEFAEATADAIEAGNPDEQDDTDPKENRKFYQIGAHIVMTDDEDGSEDTADSTFIVQTYSAVRANMLIEKHLRDRQEEDYVESLKYPNRKFVKRTINSFIEESKTVPVNYFIPVEFSKEFSSDHDS